jgi:hypothetical protein
MKPEKPALNPDDIELVPDAWDRFVRAVALLKRSEALIARVQIGKWQDSTTRPRRCLISAGMAAEGATARVQPIMPEWLNRADSGPW